MRFGTLRIRDLAFKHWFLLLLVLLLILGGILGAYDPEEMPRRTSIVDPRVTTAAITTLMSLSLNSDKLLGAIRSPGPVLTGFALNTLIVPILGLSLFSFQGHQDLQYGLLIAVSVPCTLAAASVWTRKAGGNDAVSLLVTMTTSTVCFVTTPLWLSVPTLLSRGLSSGEQVSFPSAISAETSYKLGFDLIVGALIPTFLGQILRRIPRLRKWADLRKPILGGIAQCLILLMVLVASIKAGGRLADSGDYGISAISFLIAFLSVAGIHVVGYFIGTGVSRSLGFQPEDQIAVALSGSQKTLPSGLLIASELGRTTGMNFALIPMLMYHASQLLIDTIFVEEYSRRISAARQGAEIDSE